MDAKIKDSELIDLFKKFLNLEKNVLDNNSTEYYVNVCLNYCIIILISIYYSIHIVKKFSFLFKSNNSAQSKKNKEILLTDLNSFLTRSTKENLKNFFLKVNASNIQKTCLSVFSQRYCSCLAIIGKFLHYD